ncbi:MAG: ABC transporter substrate-binding protein [Chloroflexi bacterium]|nr:ABC transporter substrate-binding protein [Chloroflexota bacterium]
MKSLSKVLSLFFIAALLLTACGSPATGTPQIVTVKETQIVEVPAGQVEVRLSGWASSPSETALLESLLYRFSVENPGITVKYEPITGDYKQALLTAIASGTEPDLYYMDIFWWQELAKNDVILPMDDLMSASGVKNEDFIPSLIDAFKFEGKTYGIPKDFNTLGLFYNKDLFDKAGLDYPTDDWTWDDLKTAAEKTTDLTDATKPVYGICMAPDAGRFPIFVFQNGGTVMNADYTDTTLDSDAAIGAAQFYTDFRANKTGVAPADVGEGWQGTVFGKGQCAMVYEGGWLISYLRDQFPGTKYGVVIPPAGPGGEGNLIFTVAWGISKNTKNPEAAWKVVDFLTNEASQKTVLESGFALPTRISLQGSEYFTNNSNSAAIFNGALNNAQPFFWGSVGSDVNDQMSKALERIYKESQPVADALKQAAEAVREALKQ